MAHNWGQNEIQNQTWWKRRSALERGLTIVAVFGILLSIGLAIGLGVEASKCKSEKPSNGPLPAANVCLHEECIHTASHVLNNMDKTVDPCHDFYHFACGSFINSTTIPDDKTRVTTFDVIQDELMDHLRSSIEEEIDLNGTKSFTFAKKFYQSCMNKTEIEKLGLEPLQTILKEIGGWPVVEGDKWDEKTYNWIETVYKLRKLGLVSHSIISFGVETDVKNNSQRAINIDQASLGLSREFLVQGQQEKFVNAYYKYMVDIALLIGANNKTAVENELLESLNFEIQIAKISLPAEEMRNISAIYNRIKIEALEKDYAFIPWKSYMEKLLPESIPSLDSKEEVIVSSLQYLKDLEQLLKNTTKRVQANYVIWRTVSSLVPYLNDQVRARQLSYLTETSGITEREPRWKECVNQVTNRLSIGVGALYVRRYFQKDAKDKAVEMVQDIRDTFINKILTKIEWMDEAVKKSAVEKAKEMGSYIAFPDELLNDTIIDEYYNNLQIDDSAYMQNILNIAIFGTEKDWGRLHEPVDKTVWYEHATTAIVNAFYSPAENSIQIPAGILQGSFFHEDRPRYMNYGAIGYVIGHEVTHGFDDQGSQFDKDGNLVDWWSPSSKEKYLEKAKCIVDQYSNYTVEEVGLQINGKNTQGENIADNGGVKVAYIAYNDWVKRNGMELRLPGLDYTPNQMFWISVANNWCSKYRPETLKKQIASDPHSPSEFRVLGPLSNTPEFAKDFNCPSGSRMNPVHTCSVW